VTNSFNDPVTYCKRVMWGGNVKSLADRKTKSLQNVRNVICPNGRTLTETSFNTATFPDLSGEYVYRMLRRWMQQEPLKRR
jgi:hypothetical protein